MAIFDGINQAIVTQRVQAKLGALRDALNDIANEYKWTSGVSVADLQGIGFSAAGANAILSGVADANAISQLYSTGLPPATYPQPTSAYPYEASQAIVLGP